MSKPLRYLQLRYLQLRYLQVFPLSNIMMHSYQQYSEHTITELLVLGTL